jgi:hypothetical protein
MKIIMIGGVVDVAPVKVNWFGIVGELKMSSFVVLENSLESQFVSVRLSMDNLDCSAREYNLRRV